MTYIFVFFPYAQSILNILQQYPYKTYTCKYFEKVKMSLKELSRTVDLLSTVPTELFLNKIVPNHKTKSYLLNQYESCDDSFHRFYSILRTDTRISCKQNKKDKK